MAKYRRVNPRIWDDKWFQSLDFPSAKLFFYLLTSQETNRIGIVTAAPEIVSVRVGLEVGDAVGRLEQFEGDHRIRWDRNENMILLLQFLRHNPPIGRNQRTGYLSDVRDLLPHPFAKAVLVMLSPGLEAMVQNHEVRGRLVDLCSTMPDDVNEATVFDAFMAAMGSGTSLERRPNGVNGVNGVDHVDAIGTPEERRSDGIGSNLRSGSGTGSGVSEGSSKGSRGRGYTRPRPHSKPRAKQAAQPADRTRTTEDLELAFGSMQGAAKEAAVLIAKLWPDLEVLHVGGILGAAKSYLEGIDIKDMLNRAREEWPPDSPVYRGGRNMLHPYLIKWFRNEQQNPRAAGGRGKGKPAGSVPSGNYPYKPFGRE